MLVNRSTGDVPGGPVAKTGLLPIEKPGFGPWSGNFPGAQTVKNLPAMQETWVRSLGGEDPLEKGRATHFRIFACRIPWTEEPSGLQSMGLRRVRHD